MFNEKSYECLASLPLFTEHSSSNINVNKTVLLGVRKHLHVNTLEKGCLKGSLKLTNEFVRKRRNIEISFAATVSFCDIECAKTRVYWKLFIRGRN